MMKIVKKVHVTDVRDIGDIKKKREKLDEIFKIGKELAMQHLNVGSKHFISG